MRAALLLSFLIVLTWPTLAQKNVYEKSWSKVYQYELENLTKSAQEEVEIIYKKAKADKNTIQITKALIYQSKFALTLEEDAELRIINRFKTEVSESQFPHRNILECMLATIYWGYFKENRWRYYNRSNTDQKINESDFRTWDSRQILQEIQSHYESSLQNELKLQQISLQSFDEILVQAIDSKIYRPTLFDFLAHEALNFYQANESGDTKSVFRFKLNDVRYWHDFMNVPLLANDSLAPMLQAVKIYRKLLTFHQNDQDPTAYITMELERWNFLYEQGTYTDAALLYKNALTQFKARYAQHPSSTLIDFELAALLFKEGGFYKPNSDAEHRYKKKEAWKLCDEGIRKFPQGYGAEKCRILKANIELPKLQLTAERFVPVRKFSRIRVIYTSIDSLSFFVYRVPVKWAQNFYQLKNDATKLAELTKLRTDTTWEVSLINSQDYQNHITEVVVPRLQQGHYLVVARAKGEKSTSPLFAYATLQCTNLAVIEGNLDKAERYQVVDRNNGRPLAGAEIHFQSRDTLSNGKRLHEHVTTNKNGFAEIKKRKLFSHHLNATVIYQTDTAHLEAFTFSQLYNNYESDADEYDAKTYLFSDRSIYRPAQTVYFKGILMKLRKKKSTVVEGEYVHVVLEDVNGDTVKTLRLKTNAYGSFSGEFKLPATGLTGKYTLYAEEDIDSETSFYDDAQDFNYENLIISVEEYKRPTFETTFQPTTRTFTLLDTVSVAGNALAYNGSKISGAKVSYRVKRNVRFPRWYYWDNSAGISRAQEITHGETTTNEDGVFTINFAAIPDENVSKETRPVFQYEITADATDINGETRSATTYVNVGYHTLLITLQGASTVDKRSLHYPIQISAENLNGQAAPAQGLIRLYKLKYPMAPIRKRPWGEPDLPVITEKEFSALFPNDSYRDSNQLKKEKGAKVMELPFNTEVTKNIQVTLDPSWAIGDYEMELVATDNAGNEIIEKHRFEISDARSKAIADHALLVFETDKPTYSVGDVAHVKVGSASPDITLTIEVEQNHQITQTYVEQFSGNYKEFNIPIGEWMGNGFRIICSGVSYNSFILQAKTIPIILDTDKMEIETITFKDKLQPGSKELWSFEIKGNNAPLKEAEVLASMYDASLDQFKEHHWYFNPQRSEPYESYYLPKAHQSFGNEDFMVRNQRYGFITIPSLYYDAFDWFGFTITGNKYVHNRYLERLYSNGTHSGKPSKVSVGHNQTIRKGYIEGTVRASDGSLIAGLNVVIKGTTIGTVSDVEGTYRIQAKKGDILVYSFIGYSTAEFEVTSKNVMDVTMEEDIMMLSEIVVVGYGAVEKKSLLTGSVTYVYESTTQGDYTLEQKLQGKVAGVQITGIPGGDARVVIRGSNSYKSNHEPLYVVDGVIVESSKIDQSDLASIQVLKDDVAVSLYGSRASEGVIIVTTKSGQKKLDEELAKVSVRKDLKETAFFFPHLTTNAEGRIQFSFTTPEALTRWKLQLLAHTKNLLTATKTLQSVTQKELMVTPNPPRFLRVGDEILFATKISNLSGESKSGSASLQLTNALTGASIDLLVGNNQRNQAFKVTARGNTQVSWKLKIPEDVDAIQYKVIAKAGDFSDGEQNVLPVLSNRILITETLPMQVRAGQTKTFRLEKLKQVSTTMQPHQLTLEITSNPAWYAIQALPYLMEYPHECAEQTFGRYYANLLGSHIANSNPKIKQVFEQWNASNTLISNLEKNPELKSILIQETPWVRDAQSESERKKRIGLLFELGKMKEQLQSTTAKLQNMQLLNGGFPWFTGGNYANTYITMHIASGLGHLKKLNVPTNSEIGTMLEKALSYLDQEMIADHNRLLKQANENNEQTTNDSLSNPSVAAFMQRKHIHSYQIEYAYTRSFFPEIKLNEKAEAALRYYHTQSKQYWNEFNLYDKAMIALIHFRNGDTSFSQQILNSLKENSIQSDEMGMYWKENRAGWHWNEAPIETQALLIEAFSEIQSSNQNIPKEEKKKTLDELRLWLLKNKQTSQWKTTKATTEAIYALLLHGTDWLPMEDEVSCRVGGVRVPMKDVSVESGTGYFKTSWKKEDVKPFMSEVVISNKGDGVAWGGLYWQYFEESDKVTSSESPLRLSKKVFLVKRTDQGELLTEVSENTHLSVGDLLRVRIELQSDRYLEFLHMNDMRAAGLEPVDALSEYKRKDGLGYYQSTKDASVNFFFDSMKNGVYVFEYDLRVNNKGQFSNGITTIQSMYAPEFSSHSNGIRITIN